MEFFYCNEVPIKQRVFGRKKGGCTDFLLLLLFFFLYIDLIFLVVNVCCLGNFNKY